MKGKNFSVTHVLVSALIVCGCIGVSAMAFRYSGKIDIRLGPEGIVFRIDGAETAKPKLLAP
jgi:hypothetical protein